MRYLLIDHIKDWEPDRTILGVKNVAMTEDFLEFHFPAYPIMPGVMLLEGFAQLAGWLHAASSDFRDWFLLESVIKCSFYGFVLPGDQVEMKVTVSGGKSENGRIYAGVGKVGGKKKIIADFQGLVFPLQDLESPVAQQRHFKILTREIQY